MAVGVVAVSLSGPLMALRRWCRRWRSRSGATRSRRVALAPPALVGRREELAGAARAAAAAGRAVAGATLALHFATWVTVADADLGRLGHGARVPAAGVDRGAGSCCAASGSGRGSWPGWCSRSPGCSSSRASTSPCRARALAGDALALVGRCRRGGVHDARLAGPAVGEHHDVHLRLLRHLRGAPARWPAWWRGRTWAATRRAVGAAAARHRDRAAARALGVQPPARHDQPDGGLAGAAARGAGRGADRGAVLLGQTPPAAAVVGLAVILAGMALVIVGKRGGSWSRSSRRRWTDAACRVTNATGRGPTRGYREPQYAPRDLERRPKEVPHVRAPRAPLPPFLPRRPRVEPAVPREGAGPRLRPGVPRHRGLGRADREARRPQEHRRGAQHRRLGQRGCGPSG